MSIKISVPCEPPSCVGGEGGKAAQVVTAGARLTALDAYDNTWDTMALGSSILSAYADHPDYAPGHRFLARDYRFDSYPKQWDMYVISDQDGQPVTLALTAPQTTSGACLGISLNLTDVTAGAPVDLLQPTYMYTNSAGVPRQFRLTASQVVETPPSSPANLFSPRVGTTSVLLAWTGVNGASVVGYHVYRKDPGSSEYRRRTVAPAPAGKYIDGDVNPGSYSYLVTAVTSTGCESGPSNGLAVFVGQ
ncbi:MAG: fibronectin type III domain-containing protein [Nitrospirota bacterium]